MFCDIMFYGSFLEGFKGGGWNLIFNFVLIEFDLEVGYKFDQEEVEIIEVGFKFDIIDNFWLNGVIFSLDYIDL